MPIVSVNLVVLNGERYVRYFLDSLEKQTYLHNKIELNVLDNGSTDKTKGIVRDFGFRISGLGFAKFNFVSSVSNLGMWLGQEELLKYSGGKYIITTAVDIILDENFIKNAVEAMERDDKIGALQPKIYRFELGNMNNESRGENHNSLSTIHYSRTIDTCGFKIFRSRRVVNIGHGEENKGQYDGLGEIFAVEGAAPVFRKEALESCRISQPATEIVDHDLFWYGDDLDLAWRMRILGWKEIFAPDVIAWHDRQTTKTLKKTWSDYFKRVPVRRQIPIKKRRLDWRNTRWTFVKNDYIINILKDLPWVVFREIAVLGYAILFEPGILKEIPVFFKYLPKMLRKRKEIMKKATVSPKEIRRWFN